MKHFISTLGAGNYSEIIYKLDEKCSKKGKYIQASLLELLKEEKIGKATIFCTDFSSKNFGELKKECDDKNIETEIEKKQIKDGKNNSEMWCIFNAVYDSIEENDELYIDVTHSFRSIPILLLSVISYAKAIKKITVKAIYYGAFESKEGDVAPVFDLTFFLNIMDWSYAARSFIENGDARQFKMLFDEFRGNDNSLCQNREWQILNCTVQKAATVVDCLNTCRGGKGIQGREEQSSIQGAFSRFLRQCQELENAENSLEFAKPARQLIETAKNDMETNFGFCEEASPVDVGISTVKWAQKCGNVQLAYTAMEETIITYVCEQIGIEDSCTNVGKRNICNYVMDVLCLSEEQQEKIQGFNETEKVLLKKIESSIAKELIDLLHRIRSRRNSLNHFGMNEDQMTATRIKDDLKEHIDIFTKELSK